MTFDEHAATLDRNDIVALPASHQQLAARNEELTRQLEWFKRQLFGAKSERRFLDPERRQLALGGWQQAAAGARADNPAARDPPRRPRRSPPEAPRRKPL